MSQIDQDLIDQLRVFGPESATALARRLAVSTPTVTRALKRLGDAVVAVGKGRASAYALRRHVRDLGHSWPLYKIGPDAEPVLLGTLQALQGRYRWRLAPAHPLPLFMRREFADGLYEDLPWFLQALRPQGYLGRINAKRFIRGSEFPEDIQLWQAEDIVESHIRIVQDASGNLALGSERSISWNLGALMALAKRHYLPASSNKCRRYETLALNLENEPAEASSAAGERPKFVSNVVQDDETIKPVIVKFVQLIEGNPTTHRWADLLVAEEVALATLRKFRHSSVECLIISHNQLRFLESTRFDRTPQGGRIGVFALDALDMAYVGSDQRGWLAGALPLHAQGMIDADDIETIRLLDAFGRLIGNDDMHHGNLSFFAEPESERLKLAPVYDMLPMHYRPSPTGLTHDRPFALPQPDRAYPVLWKKAGAMAAAFWTAAAADPRLSADFAAICAGNVERIAAWRTEHGL